MENSLNGDSETKLLNGISLNDYESMNEHEYVEKNSKRDFCLTCYKASSVCICSRFSNRVRNRTAITILQHPKEKFHPLGSARVALLGLSNVHVIVVPLGVGRRRINLKIPGSKRSLGLNRRCRKPSTNKQENSNESGSATCQTDNNSLKIGLGDLEPNCKPTGIGNEPVADLLTNSFSTRVQSIVSNLECDKTGTVEFSNGGKLEFKSMKNDHHNENKNDNKEINNENGKYNGNNSPNNLENGVFIEKVNEFSSYNLNSDMEEKENGELKEDAMESHCLDESPSIIDEFSRFDMQLTSSPTLSSSYSDWSILSDKYAMDEDSTNLPPWLPFHEGIALLYPSPQSIELPNLSNVSSQTNDSAFAFASASSPSSFPSSTASSTPKETLLQVQCEEDMLSEEEEDNNVTTSVSVSMADKWRNEMENVSSSSSSSSSASASPPVSSSLPKHFIVLDGTWPKAKRIYHQNPWLKNIPHYRLPLIKPSSYGPIRKEPKQGCMSTIEAIVYALKAIEPDTDGLDSLLHVFDSMVEDQIRCMPKYNHVASTSNAKSYQS